MAARRRTTGRYGEGRPPNVRVRGSLLDSCADVATACSRAMRYAAKAQEARGERRWSSPRVVDVVVQQSHQVKVRSKEMKGKPMEVDYNQAA